MCGNQARPIQIENYEKNYTYQRLIAGTLSLWEGESAVQAPRK